MCFLWLYRQYAMFFFFFSLGCMICSILYEDQLEYPTVGALQTFLSSKHEPNTSPEACMASKTFVGATQPTLVCASPETKIPVNLSYQPGLIEQPDRPDSSTGQKVGTVCPLNGRPLYTMRMKNTRKCGELKLCFSTPSAGASKTKQNYNRGTTPELT